MKNLLHETVEPSSTEATQNKNQTLCLFIYVLQSEPSANLQGSDSVEHVATLPLPLTLPRLVAMRRKQVSAPASEQSCDWLLPGCRLGTERVGWSFLCREKDGFLTGSSSFWFPAEAGQSNDELIALLSFLKVS